MTFRANKNGTWVGGDNQSEGTVVYGKSGGNWLYAKEVFAKKDGTWVRAWTDCRQHDASGRDWGSSSSAVTVSCGSCDSCGTNTKVVTTVTYTKTGCPTYTRSSETSCTGCTGSWNFIDPFSGSSPSSVSVGGVTYNQSLYGYTDYSSCGYCQINAWDLYQCSATSAYRVVYAGCFSLEFC